MKTFVDFINEKIEAVPTFGFTSLVPAQNVDFDSFPLTGEQYVDAGELTVYWEMDFDNRKNGINSMAPIINKISGNFNLITPADETDGEEEQDFIAEKDSDWEFVCEFQKEYTFGSAIMPESITVDFKDNKITILF